MIKRLIFSLTTRLLSQRRRNSVLFTLGVICGFLVASVGIIAIYCAVQLKREEAFTGAQLKRPEANVVMPGTVDPLVKSLFNEDEL